MPFKAVILSGKKTATGIEVPAEALEQLAAGKKPAVVVTVNGYVYRTTVGSMDGRFMLPFSAEHRERSGLAAGDAVEVELALDTEPRVLELPADLAAALAANPEASKNFDRLSYSRRRWFVLNVEAAKTPATRDKRVASAIATLAAE